jgi:hypothetical protein
MVLISSISNSEKPTMTVDHYPRTQQVEPDSMLAVRKVCRNVLNVSSFRFVAANAPADVVSSFGAQQQRLARLSLQVTSSVLVQQLRHHADSFGSFSRSLRSFMSQLKNVSVLGACAAGRVALGVLRGLSIGIPQQVQIFVSAQILARVGSLLTDEDHLERPISNDVRDELLASDALPGISDGERRLSAVTADILRALSISLPNDLSRLIFLATLRDNNSGHYYHPDVARRFSVETADRAMLACHREIYERVVALALEDLTEQLDAYMATVRVPKARSIESWTKLRAYRATIPMDTDPISAEIFFMKVGVAVAILEARLPGRVR